MLLYGACFGFDNIRCFRIIEANGFDISFEALFPKAWIVSGVLATGNSLAVALLTLDVCRLAEQNHRDQQFKWSCIV